MRILVYAAEPADRKLAGRFPEGAELEILPLSSFSRSYRRKAPGAFVYFDARAASRDRMVSLGRRLEEGVEGSAWGVIDPVGLVTDPAGLFFDGASDYLGPALLKAGLEAGRLKAAFESAGLLEAEGSSESGEEEGSCADFAGWEALRPGDTVKVRFCYAALGGQRELFESIGEKRLQKLREGFAAFLEPWSAESGGIVWIRENQGSLLLFPPGDEGMNPVLAAYRLILDRALVGYEVFSLEVPLTFRFAFHSGETVWRPPGETGTIIAEDINFVFHLGSKFPGDGQVLVSGDAEPIVPRSLRPLFDPAGDFEGRPVLASRRFRD